LSFFNKEIDFIFHLAAQINLRYSFENPPNDADVNIVGSLNVIQLAKKHNAKLIFASTGGALYSDTLNEPPWNTWANIDPKSPYSLAKHTVERYLKILEVKHVILRLSNVYGPRQNHKGEAGVVSIFINNILDGKDLTIFGDGSQTRDFIYVDDVVEAFIGAVSLHPHNNNRAYNISTGIGTDITTIAHMIIGDMWANRSVVYSDPIPGELKDSILNYNLPNWKPKVSLDEGIKRTVKYFSDI